MATAETKPKTKRAKAAAPAFTRKAYILRTCNADLTSYGGFQWAASGIVSAPDWKATKDCGNGLHGFLNGEGDGGLASFEPDAKWLVAEIEEWIDLRGKVKFPRANVVHCGDRLSACQFLVDAGISGAIVGGTATAGDSGTATAGDRGTATAGDSGTATAGYSGTATAGDRGTATAGDSGTATAGVGGTATAGDSGTATAGVGGTATAGDRGTATAGVGGTATAGDSGTATAGDGGTATAGDRGTATAGVGGTATAGDRGTATAGDSGIIIIRFYDYAKERYRVIEGYIGEDGILANTPYHVIDGRLVAKVQGL
jgi:hypothetical protein